MRVDCQHHYIGCQCAVRRANDRRSAAIQLDHRAVLIDAHSQLLCRTHQTANEIAGVNGGSTRLKDALEMNGRASASRNLLGRELCKRRDAEAVAELNNRAPRTPLDLSRCRPQPAAPLELRVDVVPLTGLFNLRNRLLGGLRQLDGLALTCQLDQRRQFRPPTEHEAPVATRGSTTTDVPFDDHHVERRLTLLQQNRRPQPEIATTNNRHVRVISATQDGRIG